MNRRHQTVHSSVCVSQSSPCWFVATLIRWHLESRQASAMGWWSAVCRCLRPAKLRCEHPPWEAAHKGPRNIVSLNDTASQPDKLKYEGTAALFCRTFVLGVLSLCTCKGFFIMFRLNNPAATVWTYCSQHFFLGGTLSTSNDTMVLGACTACRCASLSLLGVKHHWHWRK